MDDLLSRPAISPAERRALIAAQADQLAELLNLDPKAIAVDSHGVSLSPRQAEVIITLARAGKASGSF